LPRLSFLLPFLLSLLLSFLLRCSFLSLIFIGDSMTYANVHANGGG
jgi:hypothetical protein